MVGHRTCLQRSRVQTCPNAGRVCVRPDQRGSGSPRGGPPWPGAGGSSPPPPHPSGPRRRPPPRRRPRINQFQPNGSPSRRSQGASRGAGRGTSPSPPPPINQCQSSSGDPGPRLGVFGGPLGDLTAASAGDQSMLINVRRRVLTRSGPLFSFGDGIKPTGGGRSINISQCGPVRSHLFWA